MTSGNMVFRAVGSKKKSVQVAEQIIAAIQQGVYKVGDKLPPERVIGQETGVSKTSVREALSALHLAGIVERIPGSGTYVRNSAEGLGALALLEESESVDDALEARWIIERSVIELAIERITSEQLERLEEILAEMRQPLEEKDYEDYIKLNERFHLAIAEATDNPLIVRVIKLLLKVTRQELWKKIIVEYFLRDEKQLRSSFEEHQRIVQAIKKRDKEQARRVMEDHFIKVRKILQDNL